MYQAREPSPSTPPKAIYNLSAYFIPEPTKLLAARYSLHGNRRPSYLILLSSCLLKAETVMLQLIALVLSVICRAAHQHEYLGNCLPSEEGRKAPSDFLKYGAE
ncbi:hypothetical protein OIDMADRAFT_18507 [Oidiodendron maius Zn]|uniref:Uncharacterized protein n=1 Tax=Oidiodendron maius (strain Zn) TaxID=913774 RepID=A0A0C3DLV6_OIDMZ|nr:hypothetical protein OIDMADRAFT_18507 [Oidiodendron maius Zn]